MLPPTHPPPLKPAAATWGGLATAMLCLAWLQGSAGAQIDPDDSGEGHRLGLAQLNNSGQVGTATVFERGGGRTLLLVRVESVPPGRTEPARLRRGHSCTHRLHYGAALPLAPVNAGSSRTVIDLPLSRLLSGNYLVEILAGTARGRVSCGQLYR